MNTFSEIWRTVDNHSDYEVSNEGRVRSTDKSIIVDGKTITIPSTVLKPCVAKNGKMYVNFDYRTYYIHRLVAEAFLHSRPTDIVIHKDNNPSNNSVSNLKCITYAEKYKSDLKLGLRPPPPKNEGKPVICIETGKIYTNMKSAALDTALSPESVSNSAYLNKTIKGHTFALV